MQQSGSFTRVGWKHVFVDRRRQGDFRRSGRGCHRAIPERKDSDTGRQALARGLPNPQLWLPRAKSSATGKGPGGWGRKHGISDSEGTVENPLGQPCYRYAANTVASKAAGSRSVLVADQNRHHKQDSRIAARPTNAKSGHSDRFATAGAKTLRRRPKVTGGRQLKKSRHFRGRRRARGGCRHLGHGISIRPLVDYGASGGRPWGDCPQTRRHRYSRALLSRPLLATHPRLSVARLGKRR